MVEWIVVFDRTRHLHGMQLKNWVFSALMDGDDPTSIKHGRDDRITCNGGQGVNPNHNL